MARENPPYRAYLLRCWQEGEAAPGEEPHWRFSLEEILHERRRKGFDSLEALVAFLRAELTGGRGERFEGEGPNPWRHAGDFPRKLWKNEEVRMNDDDGEA